jgi:DNA-binding transcriptional LysR family regulator
MNFQQLRALRETVRRGLNVTAAAEALFTSQPALSKQIRELEEELGVQLFVRRGKKYAELTEAGQRVLELAERLLVQADNIRRVGQEYASGETGTLSIAATHTQARYALPRRLAKFRQQFPAVRLQLHQGHPEQVAEMVAHGEAIFGLATESLDQHPALRTVAIYQWHHCVVVPNGHELASRTQLELSTIAQYPVVTYTPEFAGRRKVDLTFSACGLRPDIVLEAIDSDVIKEYVLLGMGIGLIAEIAFDPERDRGLVKIDLGETFPTNVAKLAMRSDLQLRGFEQRFVQMMIEGDGNE